MARKAYYIRAAAGEYHADVRDSCIRIVLGFIAAIHSGVIRAAITGKNDVVFAIAQLILTRSAQSATISATASGRAKKQVEFPAVRPIVAADYNR